LVLCPTYEEVPDGHIRIPDELNEAAFADVMMVTPKGQEVEVLFARRTLDPTSETDGATLEAVARIFMPRLTYEHFVGVFPQTLAHWRQLGI